MKHKLLYVWLQQALGLYNRFAGEIFARFGSIEEIYNCDDFSFLGEQRAKYIKRLESKDTTSAFETVKRCEAIGASITGFYDGLYPEKLRHIEMPPVVLYSIGNLKDLNKIPCIAIVGTRKMTDYGREITETFAYNFAKSGACVVSGLAKGVDTAAHRGAVMADGYTVAVLGNPIGDIYPRENEKAFETLYRCGLVLSELYPGAPRTKADFPNRNRIISGLSDAVVIAEAGENSGALITARHAITQGKAVYAVPGAIGAENAGTNRLIKTGVAAATEPFDVISPLSLEYPESIKIYQPSMTRKLRSYGNAPAAERPDPVPKSAKRVKQEQPEPPKEKATPREAEPFHKEVQATANASQRILAVLKGYKPLSADEISVATGICITEVMTELTLMEIDGSIISCVGGRFTASKF